MSTNEERSAAYFRECVKRIAAHGWMVQGVFPTTTNPGPPFAYTVGLTTHGFPELAIAGLPVQVMQTLLNDLASMVFHLKRRFSHREVLADILGGGHKVTIVEGEYTRETIWPGTAHALYGADAVTLQQMVWPDDQGRFPWDDGYSLPPDGQPVIGSASLNYDEAMAAIRRKGTVEVGRAGMRIRWRFGKPVVCRAEGGHIDYTPTSEDMHATDWKLINEPLDPSWTVRRSGNPGP